MIDASLLRRLPWALLLFALLFAALMGAGALVQPAPLRASAAEGQFEAGAARAHPWR